MTTQKLKKYCIYAGDEWMDIIRIHPVPCDGGVKYIARNVEEEDLYISRAVGFFGRTAKPSTSDLS